MIREPTLEEIQQVVTLPFNESDKYSRDGVYTWEKSLYNNIMPELPKTVWVTLLSQEDEPYKGMYLYDEHMIVCEPFTESNQYNNVLRWLQSLP